MANIAKVYIEVTDETKPAGDRARSLGDDDIREFKRTIRERLAEDHQFVADETGLGNIGTHKKITFSETQGSDPTVYDDCGYLYIKTVNAVKELFWKDSAGSVKQLTNAGKLMVAAADIAAIGANVDFGAYEVRAQTLEADVADGTAPLTITSTTKVTNLNADQVDGYDASLTAVASKIPVTDADGLLTLFVSKAKIGIDSGSVSFTTGQTKTIDFNFAFSAAPTVILSVEQDVDSNVPAPNIRTIATTEMSVRNAQAATVTIHWLAIGTPA